MVGWERVEASALSHEESSTLLTAGLVNAHTHLDLGALRGVVSADGGFLAWVGALVAARGELDAGALKRGVRASARSLVATGTTAALDVDGGVFDVDLARGVALEEGLRSVVVSEVLDGSPAGRTARSTAALALAKKAILAGRGLSPHATHTVGDALLEDVATALREANAGLSEATGHRPVVVHWAETPEETEWLLTGGGPFAEWLGPSPKCAGTERLARAGLLDGAVLIHGNHPQAGEPDRLRSSGCTVVHCPGSHEFFGREPFPHETYVGAGVPIALGTDSWASNDALDMRREIRLARRSLGVSPREAWRMGTVNGAGCLGDPAATGTIEAGAVADLVRWDSPDVKADAGLEALLEALIEGDGLPVESWSAGARRVARSVED